MEYRRLGASGLQVSEVGYGNWLTSTTAKDPGACVRAALDAGVNTLHTSASWGAGSAEESLAEALSGVDRDTLVLCTGTFWPEGQDPNGRGLSRKNLVNSLHRSLRRLRTDYVDIYQLMQFDHHTPLPETFLALSDLVRQGKILYVAISEWSAEQISRAATFAAEFHVPLIANQPTYSMLWRVPEAQVMPACQRAGIGQLVSMTMGQGLLTGKYRGGEIPDGSRAADPRTASAIRPLLGGDLLDRVLLLETIAADTGLTMAQLAIAWTLQNQGVGSALTGASTPEQVAENTKASGVKLDFDVLTQIDELLSRFIQTDPRLTFSAPQPTLS